MDLVGSMVQWPAVFVHRTDDDQSVVLTIQVLLGDTSHFRSGDGADVLRILFNIIKPKVIDFRMSEEARNLTAGFKREYEAAGKVVLGILKLLFSDGFFNNTPDLVQ